VSGNTILQIVIADGTAVARRAHGHHSGILTPVRRRLIDAVETKGHCRAQVQVRLSATMSPQELALRYKFLEAEKWNRLGMMPEMECMEVAHPWHEVIEIGLPPTMGKPQHRLLVSGWLSRWRRSRTGDLTQSMGGLR
jgi:hypothetical protein